MSIDVVQKMPFLFKKSLIASSVLMAVVGCNVAVQTDQTQAIDPDGQVLSGSVGDGPIVGSTIIITDSSQKELVREYSDQRAHYNVKLPPNIDYPVTITSTGGIDLVTGMAPGFNLMSASMSVDEKVVNINPFSTLIVKTAFSMPGGASAENMAKAKDLVLKQLNFGLDSNVINDPISANVTPENIANIVKSSEAMGEMVRRVSSAFLIAGILMSGDQVVDTLAADLADGVIDGIGEGADPRVAAVSTVISGQILVEALRNSLYVDGYDATTRMDSAIAMVSPMATMTTADVPLNEEMIAQAKVALSAMQELLPSDDLSTISAVLESVTAEYSASEIDNLLAQVQSSSFDPVVNQAVNGTAEQLELVNALIRSAYPVTMDSNVDAGTTDPVVDTGATDPVVDTGTTGLVVDTGATDPVVDTGTTDPVVDTGTTDPVVITGAIDPVVDTGTTDPVVDTGTTAPVVSTDPLLPGVFEFSSSTYTVDENGGKVDITIQRVGGSDGAVTVEMRTRTFNGYGTADYQTDYGTFNWTTFTFSDGETSKVVSVKINDDSDVEDDETFSVLLQNPTNGATLGGTTSSLVTIVDNDVVDTPVTTTNTVVEPLPLPVSSGKYPQETSLTFVSVPSVAKPGYLSPITDPKFGTKITRVTDSTAFGQSNITNAYAKVQPWNSDGSLILVRRWILDGSTYKIKRTLNINGETRWANTNPNVIYNAPGGTDNRFMKINATTGEKTVLHTFAGYKRCFIGPWQGNLSADDRYIALACNKDGETGNDASWPRHAIIYDIQNDVVITEKTFNKNIKWVSMSQSGKYVVIRWLDTSPYMQSFDKQLNFISTLAKDHSHGDLTYDMAGNEVYVQYHGIGKITSYRLSDGKATSHLDYNGMDNGHLSCRNVQQPGWCTLSVYKHTGDFPGSAEVFSLKLDGSQTVRRFAHHHSVAGRGNNFGAPEGAISPDGTKVMFTSNWGGSEINSYIAEMP